MDAETLPLLPERANYINEARFLTYEEVLRLENDVFWRRARTILALVFWTVMAIMMSVVYSILVGAPGCAGKINVVQNKTVAPLQI